jgi:hypothetical protein
MVREPSDGRTSMAEVLQARVFLALALSIHAEEDSPTTVVDASEATPSPYHLPLGLLHTKLPSADSAASHAKIRTPTNRAAHGSTVRSRA